MKLLLVASAVLAAGLVLAGCDPTSAPVSPPPPSAAPAPAPVSTAVASATADPTVAGTTTVARVKDGDTFVTTDGQTVRVLGIDSCESSTPNGPAATAQARQLLLGQPVTLTTEPGVDRDRYGRELRYVATPAGDFGEAMVPADHTAVYAGRNDASAARVATLRSLDVGGRDCGDETPAPASTTTSAAPADDGDDNDHVVVPAPHKPHTGHSGHPCGPGERDGDGDGYCGE